MASLVQSEELALKEDLAYFRKKSKELFESNGDEKFNKFIRYFREYLRLHSHLHQIEYAIEHNIPSNRPMLGYLHIKNLEFSMIPHEDYDYDGEEAFIACISYRNRPGKISQPLFVFNDCGFLILNDMANYVFPIYDKTDCVGIQLYWVTRKDDNRTDFKEVRRDIYRVYIDPWTKKRLDCTKYKPNVPSIELTFDELEFRFEH